MNHVKVWLFSQQLGTFKLAVASFRCYHILLKFIYLAYRLYECLHLCIDFIFQEYEIIP